MLSVKPDPVKHLQVEVVSSTSISITWFPPANSSISLQYEVTISSKWSMFTVRLRRLIL